MKRRPDVRAYVATVLAVLALGCLAPASEQAETTGGAESAGAAVSDAPMVSATLLAWTVQHDSLVTLGTIGRRVRMAGQFESAHSLAADSRGNPYVGEALSAMRALA